MIYRKEIDGLRSIAVIPVILFHAGFSGFSGGFAGVDVFFVISGYLITSILLSDLSAGHFSILRFYERRARRILPALFFVVLACLPLALAWLAPFELRKFGASLVAVSLFASNILFWTEKGYFDSAAELKPLLHTWSLAVEEQYYIIVPVFLLLLWRFGRAFLGLAFAIVFLASLGLAEVLSKTAPTAAFYLLPSRAWELALGAFAALILGSQPPRERLWRNQVGAFLGLAMILGAQALVSEATRWPSLQTLIPTVGTLLVILFATRNTLVGTILSLPPLVWIGKFSYSAYLWHQPLFAFAKYRTLGEPSAVLMAALTLLTLLLAFVTWRYVEQPFRRAGPEARFGRAAIFGMSGLGIAASAVIGFAVYRAEGLPARTPQLSGQDLAFAGDGVPWIVTPEADHVPFVLIGDSHAKHFFATFKDRLGDGALFAGPNCFAFATVHNLPRMQRPLDPESCLATADRLADYLRQHRTTRIYLSYFWDHDIAERGTGQRIGSLRDPAVLSKVMQRVERDLRQLAPQSEIVLIGGTPAARPAGPGLERGYARCLFLAGADCPTSYPRARREDAEINAMLARWAEGRPNLRFIRPSTNLCDAERCFILRDGALLYSDGAHLTRPGADLALRDLLN
ncbi:acyltransferase family protein [Pseudodonghicola flavimaris]|uniref:Acyltransferase family protein n=1 Tax=Pseudodonghicola flavimaris TaxID=3050036 RepID=A0ABT7F379_9RHOB|nr:acyltransferase family protein [Pseudodonghicola flavimaris]MDK3019061.1 acyltransferase family protein [Pseudodonghicola flavimaris]